MRQEIDNKLEPLSRRRWRQSYRGPIGVFNMAKLQLIASTFGKFTNHLRFLFQRIHVHVSSVLNQTQDRLEMFEKSDSVQNKRGINFGAQG